MGIQLPSGGGWSYDDLSAPDLGKLAVTRPGHRELPPMAYELIERALVIPTVKILERRPRDDRPYMVGTLTIYDADPTFGGFTESVALSWISHPPKHRWRLFNCFRRAAGDPIIRTVLAPETPQDALEDFFSRMEHR